MSNLLKDPDLRELDTSCREIILSTSAKAVQILQVDGLKINLK